MDIYKNNKKGFTLVELLIAVAIIGVLVAISVPIFGSQLEKSRNAVDMHNAKAMANAIVYYFIDNPEALAVLTAQCEAKGGSHCVQVSVAETNMAVAQVLRPALNQAGLIGQYNANTDARFTDITCKSKTRWAGYRVAVSNYSGTPGKPGELKVYYWGVPVGGTVHYATSLGGYQTATDSTGFKYAMAGAG